MISHSIVRLVWALTFLLLSLVENAAVPVPDYVIYGTIAINGRPVTKADTNVTIEARRSGGGPVITSYRMGATSRLGDFYYALRLSVAAAADATPSQAVLGDSIVITVRSAQGIAHQVTNQVTEPGVALRLDLGAGVDSNGDGVTDGWELATFGTVGANLTRDTDGDGASDRAEYSAGTHPKDAADVFRIAVENDGASIQVNFRALRAAGPGYEGRTRYYSLEGTSDVASGNWQSIENMSRIPGTDQLVTYSPPDGTNAPAFFRARVWIE